MKRITFISVIFAFLTLSASAQDLYSAMEMSENLYYGSARSIALGNAVTSLGGDLGMIGINPAGGAVSPYHQISLSPALSISSTDAAYAPTFDSGKGLRDGDFTSESHTNKVNFIFPNGGFNFYLETGKNYGIKGVSVGFVSNNTHSYMNNYSVGGNNNHTSVTGAMAYRADGVPLKTYLSDDAYRDYSLDYFAIMAAGSGMIENVGLMNNVYKGVAEDYDEDGNLCIPGDLSQVANVSTFGSKTDLAFNVGLDIDRAWYVGFSLGIPVISYIYKENFREAAIDPEQFENYSHSLYDYTMNRQANGIYAKLGVIWLPAKGLRLGFAAQTPVWMNIVDNYSLDGSCSRSGGSYKSDGGDRSNSYSARLPYRLNAGISYTFGSRALVSVDYEMADFSINKYFAYQGAGDNIFNAENTINRLFNGVSHNFRAGVEVHVTPQFALRAGYGLLTSPLCHYSNCSYGGQPIGDIYAEDFSYEMYETGLLRLGSKIYAEDFKHSISAGLGYSSSGSFFADLAVRCTNFNKSDFVVYNDYAFTEEQVLLSPSPTVRSRKALWDVVLTIGWRF